MITSCFSIDAFVVLAKPEHQEIKEGKPNKTIEFTFQSKNHSQMPIVRAKKYLNITINL